MTLYFFPRDKLFWRYHCIALSILVALTLLINYFATEERLFNTVAGLVWMQVYSIAVLAFRYAYKKRGWHSIPSTYAIPGVLFYALIAGALVTIVMLVVVLPFFWSNLANNPDVLALKVTVNDLVFRLFISNTLQTQLLASAWIFIYISIEGNRRIREAELHNLRLANSLKESQLANLHNQLNPHFLFNALNNIRFTIYENQQKADTMLTGLSEMLRYSLESSKKDKVPLVEELGMIERYIDLIKVQMEDRLQFSSQIPEPIKRCLIPPMVLQLLVENAVKHGIDQLRNGGAITLSALEADQHLVFTINNSRGHSSASMPNKVEGIGIGLANIQSRLQLLYGDNARLEIYESENSFEVKLVLPMEVKL